jgi:hypothetical protein
MQISDGVNSMTNHTDSAQALVETAYKTLEFDQGELLSTDARSTDLTPEQWIEKGDWLSLAKKVGAEKVFFVNNDPVIVFAKHDTNDAKILRQIFNKFWCMARPMLLFLARPGELAVYDLSQPPVKTSDEWRKPILDVAKHVAEVANKLHTYRREQVESGRLFEDERFGKPSQRADLSLIQDLKAVRSELIQAGLGEDKLKYAHALIGRSIFIRYLEDREILIPDYFEKVASQNPKWKALLNTTPHKSDLDPQMEKLLYPRVLADKDFTYALFEQLAHDFNGDMFPSISEEKSAVNEEHLLLLQKFLRGETGPQQTLFFWAYRFEIIPIELISNIYEEFYHLEHGNVDNLGTHYTPSALVEFVLSQVLTPERLDKNPRVIDPACGSGIFLVESFRRMVRFRVQKQNGCRLNSSELRGILRDQIAGIEINDEAVRIAAFSLYLALLNYQEPPDILEQIKQGHRLPNLKYQVDQPTDDLHFNNLLEANAFDINSKVPDEASRKRFSSECADIVVGNPPWGEAKKSDNAAIAALEKALNWCEERTNPVGDKERSQAFIWRTLNLLRDEGCAGLLVSTGVFFKHHPKSRDFRRKWLQLIKLIEIVNFAHVRDIFFSGPSRGADAIAPFALVVFQKETLTNTNHLVHYWAAKKNTIAVRLQAVVLGRTDVRLIRQYDLTRNDKLWKIYWWGNHQDEALINVLELDTPFKNLCDQDGTGQGFKEANKSIPCDWLCHYKELPAKSFQRYGPVERIKFLSVPKMVEHRGKTQFYKELRLLLKRGISQSFGANGQIVARLESKPFCFRHSIQCYKLKDAKEWKYKILLAIFWSSLTRYYFFLTTSTWGMWHHEIHLEEALKMPIRFPDDLLLRGRIVKIVDKLRAWNPIRQDLQHPKGKTDEQIATELALLEHKLDEAIFDLYELSDPERDLVRDMCEIGLEFFYKHSESNAVKPVDEEQPAYQQGFYHDLPFQRDHQAGLQGYLHAFLQTWNRELEPDGEFRWRIIRRGKNSPLIAVIFSTQRKGEPLLDIPLFDDEKAWSEVLHKLENDLLVPYNSHRIYIDGMIRAVTDSDIIIIKRNENRLWTRSMAREDAEATLLQAIGLQDAKYRISQ